MGASDESDWRDGYLMQIGHALNMVCELPQWLRSTEFDDPRHFHPWLALSEAWLLNARLLADFFLDRGQEGDVEPRTFIGAGNWTLHDDPSLAAARLTTLTKFRKAVNKNTMHLDVRVRRANPLWSPPPEDDFRMASLLLDLSDRFASKLQEPYRSTLTGHLVTARSLRAWPPPVLHPDWKPYRSTSGADPELDPQHRPG